MLKYIYLVSVETKCIIVAKYTFIFNITDEILYKHLQKKKILQSLFVVHLLIFLCFLDCLSYFQIFTNLTQRKFSNMTWEEIKPKISMPIFCALTLCIFLADILIDEKK